MKLHILFLVFSMGLMFTCSFTIKGKQSKAVEEAAHYFKNESAAFTGSALQLELAVQAINSQPATISNAREMLKNCRMHYKKIEFFLAYFFPQASIVYNSPARYEVEEPSLEFRDPVGLQVIEGLLFDTDPALRKKELLQQCEVIVSSAADLGSLLYLFQASDSQLLESLRLELVRVITLNISGYDAPLLKTGIGESINSLLSVKHCLMSFMIPGDRRLDSVFLYLNSSIRFLEQSRGFDSFNRLDFLTACALPLQQHFHRFIRQHHFTLNTTPALNDEAENIFSADAINIRSFPGTGAPGDDRMVSLGRLLFSEKLLSGNNTRSCATCHMPDKFFADGLVKSAAFDETTTVQRNAPSLLYAAYQYSQFWDGKVRSLEDQVIHVMKSPVEMNGSEGVVVKRLKESTQYAALFQQAFPQEKGDAVSMENLSVAIAAFVRTLNPMNSAFDRYIRGEQSALTPEQKNGFNLFMGKAQCGTCHFAPLFNGLIPPLYGRTELEVLGSPESDDFSHVTSDKDSGRFQVYPSKFYAGAFKTPTVRNSAATAPYMHNGALRTLETVMDFYNKGGGNGLGLNVEMQTLPSTPLELNAIQIKEIISFLGALTDKIDVPLKEKLN